MEQRYHKLKTWPEFFLDVVSGVKPWELRKHDRDYEIGDYLLLEEYDPVCGYSGNSYVVEIENVVTGIPQFGLIEGHCIMSIATIYSASNTIRVKRRKDGRLGTLRWASSLDDIRNHASRHVKVVFDGNTKGSSLLASQLEFVSVQADVGINWKKVKPEAEQPK